MLAQKTNSIFRQISLDPLTSSQFLSKGWSLKLEILTELWHINEAWTVKNKKEPSIFLKIESEHRQVISSKFPKSFRGARDLMVFYEFYNDFSGFFTVQF